VRDKADIGFRIDPDFALGKRFARKAGSGFLSELTSCHEELSGKSVAETSR
jgi:hypothetical protein